MKTAYEYSKELLKVHRPSLSFDGTDYENWKINARKKLSDLLGMNKFVKTDPDINIEYKKEINVGTEIRFTFQSEHNYRVPCHLLIPHGNSKPPVMICIQGHSKGMHISLGVKKFEGDEISIKGDRDFCIRALKEGFAAIAIEQRNFGECGGTKNGPSCYEEAMNSLIMGRTTIGERIWDVSRLIDVLKSNFSDLIDTEHICCMGNSGGGTTTAYLGALNDDIMLIMPSCSMCTYKDSIGAMNHCACNFVPGITNYFEMSDLIAMSFPKYYIQVSGIEDPLFPIESAETVYNKGTEIYRKYNKEAKCALIIGNGGHRFYADDAWKKIHELLSIN